MSKLEKFQDFVEDQTDLELEWEGKYEGRFYYVGYGISGDQRDIMEFMNRLPEAEIGIGHYDHSDSMGLGQVVAWRLSKFKEEMSQ